MSEGLNAEVTAAVDELRRLRSTDPCAAIVMATAKATIHTLETQWLRSGRADDVAYGDA